MRPSRRTLVTAALFAVAVVAAWAAGSLSGGPGRERLSITAGGAAELVVIAAAALVIFLVVRRWDPADKVRVQWAMLGGACVLYFAGSLANTVAAVATGAVPPFPGLPDVFFIAMYALLGGGAIRAGLAYRRVVGVREPAFGAAAVSVLALIGIAWGLVVPIFQRPDLTFAQSAISVLYPIADTVLLLGPAVFVVLVVRQLGQGALAWPWALVAGGAAVLAGTDAGYAWLRAIGAYRPGDLIDMGWMAAFAALAIGASLARDAYEA